MYWSGSGVENGWISLFCEESHSVCVVLMWRQTVRWWRIKNGLLHYSVVKQSDNMHSLCDHSFCDELWLKLNVQGEGDNIWWLNWQHSSFLQFFCFVCSAGRGLGVQSVPLKRQIQHYVLSGVGASQTLYNHRLEGSPGPCATHDAAVFQRRSSLTDLVK